MGWGGGGWGWGRGIKLMWIVAYHGGRVGCWGACEFVIKSVQSSFPGIAIEIHALERDSGPAVSEYSRRVSEYEFPNTTVEFPNTTVSVSEYQFPNTTV